MSNLSPIVPQIAKLVRLLATDNDGERQTAVNAIERKLGLTLTPLSIVWPALSRSRTVMAVCHQEQMHEVYSMGFNDGVAKAENSRFNDDETFRDADGKPSWQTMAKCALVKSIGCIKKAGIVCLRYGEPECWDTRVYPIREGSLRWLTSVYYKLGGKP